MKAITGLEVGYDTSYLVILKEIGYIDGWKEDGKWLWEKERIVIDTQKKRRRHITKSVRSEVYLRDEGKCINCGSTIDLEYDHIIAFSNGGSNTARNIQLLCKSCNRKKSNKI